MLMLAIIYYTKLIDKLANSVNQMNEPSKHSFTPNIAQFKTETFPPLQAVSAGWLHVLFSINEIADKNKYTMI